MNKYFRAIIDLSSGGIKTGLLKLFHYKHFICGKLVRISPSAEVILHKGGNISIGEKLKIDSRSVISSLPGSKVSIGDRVSFGINNMIVCHQEIIIGDDVQFSPNVLVYDHDHDFKAVNGIKDMKYKTSPVTIGDSVWVGANTVILRGSSVGNNCVIGAGCVVKGNIPDGTILVQKRENIIMEYKL